jgi:hypothetical protein
MNLKVHNFVLLFSFRALKVIFVSNRVKVTGHERKLHEKLHLLYSSRHIVRAIKSWKLDRGVM